jgi:hypothetical protein
MPTYEEAAPILSQLIDEATFRADFPAPADEPAPLPDPTAQDRRAVYEAIRDIYATGSRNVPVVKLARQLGVRESWVRVALQQIKAAYAAVWAEPKE